MQLKTFLFDEDRGVSPVIGVILMVAITVILAAVIATFVMNMGPPETTTPNAQWDWSNTSTSITVTHDGGDAVKTKNLKLKVTDASDSQTFSTSGTSFTNSPPSELTSTDSLEGGSLGDVPVSAELIWENPNSDQTQILAEWEA